MTSTEHHRRELEQKLAELKQKYGSGDLSELEFYQEAGNLRFQAEDQDWWLEPESAAWYIAPAGTENFEPYEPVAVTAPPPPEPTPEEPAETHGESAATQGEVATGAGGTVSPPVTPIVPKPVVDTPDILSGTDSSPATNPTDEQDKTGSHPTDRRDQPTTEKFKASPGEPDSSRRTLLMAIVIAAIILVPLGILGLFWLFSSSPGPDSSLAATQTATAVALVVTEPAIATPTQTSLPTETPEPTATATATPSPVPATPTPLPSATETLLPPTETPAAQLSETATPLPTETFTVEPSPVTPTANAPIDTPTPALTITGKLAYPEFDEEIGSFRIRVIDLATGQDVIEPLLRASQPALSSDGSQLAYISWASDRIGLYRQALSGESVENTVSTDKDAHRPRWHLNGRDIVFELIKGEQKDIRFSDTAGVPGIQKGQTPAWSTDGRLVVQACQDTRCGLATVSPGGGDLGFITSNTNDIAPAVSPDGQWVAYTSYQDNNWDIWLVPLAGGEATRLTSSPEREGIPTWSPDGRWIAFVVEGGDGWRIQAMQPDGSGRQTLAELEGSLEARVSQEEYRQLGWLHESISWSN